MMTLEERAAITAFMQTLTGRRVYTDARWADPFAADGSLRQGHVPAGSRINGVNEGDRRAVTGRAGASGRATGTPRCHARDSHIAAE